LSIAPVAAQAQVRPRGSTYTGFATVYIGAAHGGDVEEVGWTPGVSMAVIDLNGIGAEVDLSHVVQFDNDRFNESGITTFTVNATWVWPKELAIVRPYVVGGVGLLRVRACQFDCEFSFSRTDWAMDVGGGVFIVFNESIGARGDLRYFRVLQDHDDLPLTGHGFFDFWRTTGGIVFSWPIR
jgi:hypothetical protein